MNHPCGVVASARLLAVALVLGAPAFAQLREDVTFRIDPGPLGPGRSAYVLGDLPEFGGNDLVRAVKLADTGAGWEVRVSLPVNTSYAYRFYDRAHDAAQVGDPNNGTPLGPVQNGSTAVVPLAPAAKRMLCHTSFAGPLLFWRQGGGAFASVPMVRVGPGRTAGESRYEVAAFAAPRGDVELYVTDASQTQRDPAVGTYVTPLDAFFLQDGQLFTYVPASSVGAQRRDYNPASPPFVRSAILNEDRGYRVLLPRGYDQHPSRRYPVVYAHDGPLWFDDPSLAVDRDAARLAELTRLGDVGELIVVCIDHAITQDPRVFFQNRLRDFVPPGDWGLTPWGPVAGHADRYVAFIQTELKPVIDALYRTRPDRDHTWTMGFSAGGVVSLYIGWDFSATFSRLASFAGQFETPNFRGRVASEPKRDIRVYLDSGTVNDYYDFAIEIYDDLIDRSTPWIVEGDLRLRIGIGQTHSSLDVGQRFAGFLEFLYPGPEAPNQLFCGAVPYGTGLGGLQTLTLGWNGTGGTAGTIDATGGGANSVGLLGVSPAPGRLDLGGLPILIELSPATVSLPLLYGANGHAGFPFDLRIPSVAGLAFYMQAFELRGGGAFASGGLQVFLCR